MKLKFYVKISLFPASFHYEAVLEFSQRRRLLMLPTWTKMSLPRLCSFQIIPFPYYLNIISHKEWANTIMIICPKKHIYFIINTLELNFFHPFHRHQLASFFLFFAQQERKKKLKIMNLSPKASYHAYNNRSQQCRIMMMILQKP